MVSFFLHIGQLFHIDFGHFLGNYKQKWGIKRERVPMVLPAEFVEVISTSEFGLLGNFELFRKLCEEAFLTIRRRASLIIRYVHMYLLFVNGFKDINNNDFWSQAFKQNFLQKILYFPHKKKNQLLSIFVKLLKTDF